MTTGIAVPTGKWLFWFFSLPFVFALLLSFMVTCALLSTLRLGRAWDWTLDAMDVFMGWYEKIIPEGAPGR